MAQLVRLEFKLGATRMRRHVFRPSNLSTHLNDMKMINEAESATSEMRFPMM